MRSPALVALLGLVSLAIPTGPARAAPAGTWGLDVRSLPAEQQRRYPLVVQKCERCHSMEKSLNHPYTVTEWRASLRRMRRLSGAGITDPQAAEIMEFLRYWAGRYGRP